MAIDATYKLASTAGQDAGNASMRQAGRTSWDSTDWNIASKAFTRLWVGPILATSSYLNKPLRTVEQAVRDSEGKS
jgi:hypothetical protein